MAVQGTEGRAAGRSVLVVDDDADIRETFEVLLRTEGYTVTTANNGRDALAKLRGGLRPDLVLLDLMMPVMDGWQFRVQQKADPALASTPVVAITANRSPQAAAIDADAYLTKPIDANALFATLERLLLAREREELRARLAEADRLTTLGTVAASVAHEINSPLAYAIANVEVVARALESPEPSLRREELVAALTEAREGLGRIRAIVRDLGTFSRPADEARTRVDVRRVLDSSANIASSEILLRAHLVKDYAEVPPVLASEARLGQVFLNLVINAAQAIPEGREGRNEIRLRTRPGAPGRVLVEVEDTGAGIPPALLGRIFEPFFTTKPIGMGTGLGLSICRNIVTMLGGELTVESKLGEGSTFRVDLPSADAAPARPRPAPPPAPTSTPGKRGRILIVDDEKMLCLTLGRLLSPPHDVTTLTSAREAASLIAGGARFDVILSDLMMPGMSGIDLYQELSRTAPDQASRMVFLTGGAFTPRATAFMAEVPNKFVEKPFDAATIERVVLEVLG